MLMCHAYNVVNNLMKILLFLEELYSLSENYFGIEVRLLVTAFITKRKCLCFIFSYLLYCLIVILRIAGNGACFIMSHRSFLISYSAYLSFIGSSTLRTSLEMFF
jgi:hypothetical protein